MSHSISILSRSAYSLGSSRDARCNSVTCQRAPRLVCPAIHPRHVTTYHLIYPSKFRITCILSLRRPSIVSRPDIFQHPTTTTPHPPQTSAARSTKETWPQFSPRGKTNCDLHPAGYIHSLAHSLDQDDPQRTPKVICPTSRSTNYARLH